MSAGSDPAIDLRRAAGVFGVDPPDAPPSDDVLVLLHGLDIHGSSDGPSTLPLSPARRHGHGLDAAEVLAMVEARRDGEVQEVLPPFAAMVWGGADKGLTARVDGLGFRHLYYRQAAGWAGVSTSARALAVCEPTGLDRMALAMQSLLGWQVRLRSPFRGVTKVPRGGELTLAAGQVSIREPEVDPRPGSRRPALDEAVRDATALLREYLGAFLDEHPDAVLQLTGGQDSRILLERVRRPAAGGSEVLTLVVPGSPDAEIAAELAQRYGMTTNSSTSADWTRSRPKRRTTWPWPPPGRLELSADPLAWASVAWAEAKAEPAPRLSGLGGEVARGFYHFGPARSVPVTRARVRRLAGWRMFANESVSGEALEPDFEQWAREAAVEDLYSIFTSYGSDWLTATDDFYLYQRMHRWAGVLASATSLERVVVNPMLDDRFLAIARDLRPADKQGSRFLSRLSCSLDEELSSIRLDGRPAPMVYAYPRATNYARLAAMTGRKVVGKIRQRVLHSPRPPVGGEILAAKISKYYHEHPEALDGVRGVGVFRGEWLDKLAAGAAVGPAAAAMLVNLEVAAADTVPRGPRDS